MRLGHDPLKWLDKKRRAGARRLPVGTIAFYGPDDKRATKAVVGIVPARRAPADELRKWFADDGDVRTECTMTEIVAFLRERDVHNVTMLDRIFGCPQEEGTDYPIGQACPACPFWAGRDRFGGDAGR